MTEEISPEMIRKTQECLGRYIKKPPLTDKLLRKPPFRFLHDIVTNVINETGFLRGLYDHNEMQSENIKDRDTKIAFLQKLIEALKKTTNEKITARPSKIIAGLEAAKTNQLLQIMGTALDKESTPLNVALDRKTKTKSKTDDKIRPKRNEEPKKLIRKNMEEKINVMKKKASPRTEKENNKNVAALADNVTQSDENNLTANKSQELSVEKLKESAVEENQVSEMEEDNKTIPVDSMSDDANLKSFELETSKKQPAEKLKQDCPEPLELQTEITSVRKPSARLRPASVRPSSARPAAPRLRDKTDIVVPPEQLVPLGKVHVIVEHAASDEDNEETVHLETVPVDDVTQHEMAVVADIPAERGHLVQQILTQIGEQTTAAVRPSEPRIDDHQSLTQYIQTLTRAANPLGKLVSYVHEDVDSMVGELRAWGAVNSSLRTKLRLERQRNHDATRPLLQQLQRLDADIARHRSMIHGAQANVLRNQHKIKQLLSTE